MRLEIDNFDGAGVCDYTASLDDGNFPKIVRKLNQSATMTCALVALGSLAVPTSGARVSWRRDTGEPVFTGYLLTAEREYLGWNEAGAVYRCRLSVAGDELALDQQTIELRPAFIQQSAGAVVKGFTPSTVDATSVEDCGIIARLDPQLRKWSDCAAEAANQARAAYSVLDGKVALRPIGDRALTIDESDPNFSPERLTLQFRGQMLNDITVLGPSEAGAYVKDYFVGDGSKSSFSLSQSPFGNRSATLLEQEYTSALDPAYWSFLDPNNVIAVNSGSLWALGGSASVKFSQQVELGGALQLQHGDVTFQAPSDGVIGGLYNGSACIAGFQIAKAGSQSTISALVNDSVTGAAITTQLNHRYLLTTRVYAGEAVRRTAWFRSSTETLGGQDLAASIRVILEVHDVDQNDIASTLAPATVLYDDVIPNAPAFCDYVLLSAADLHCSLTYTRLLSMPQVTVRTALPGQPFRTRLAGSMTDGAECNVGSGSLSFYSAETPPSNEQIVAEYRDTRTMYGQATRTLTDGTPGASDVAEIVSPATRTSVDCSNAAQAMLDDTTQVAWAGEYQSWSDFLPDDIWPGDVVHMVAPSRGCEADLIVREVAIDAVDPANERNWCTVKFANEAAVPVAIEARPATKAQVQAIVPADPTVFVLESLSQAQVTDITSTQVTMDMGCEPRLGGGFEIRLSDSGWDPRIDRNLVGRFNTRSITVARLSRVVSYWVRQFDAQSRYSRWATLLHVDYPL